MPIVGDIRTVQRTETSTINISFGSNPTLAVNRPDGTVGLVSAVTVTPGIPALQQALQARITFNQGGIWTGMWTEPWSDGDTLQRPDVWFAAYTDIYRLIRSKSGLNRDSTSLPDYSIDLQLANVLRTIEVNYPTCLYRALLGIDQEWFDRGLAYSVMAAFRRNPMYIGETGPLVQVKQRDVWYRYAPLGGGSASGRTAAPPSETEKPISEQWLDLAYDAFERVSCINVLIEAFREDARIFAANGPTRAIKQLGSTNNMLMSLLYNVQWVPDENTFTQNWGDDLY